MRHFPKSDPIKMILDEKSSSQIVIIITKTELFRIIVKTVAVKDDCQYFGIWALASKPFVEFWFWRNSVNAKWHFPQPFFSHYSLESFFLPLSVLSKNERLRERTFTFYFSLLFFLLGLKELTNWILMENQ